MLDDSSYKKMGTDYSFCEIELEDLVSFPPCPDPPSRTPLPAIATPELLSWNL